LALISLSNKASGASVSHASLQTMDYLVGVSYREKGIVGLHGRILEISNDTIGEYLADLGGTHGFSGTGYYYQGKLAAIHCGQGEFIHHYSFTSMMNSVLSIDLKQALLYPSQTNINSFIDDLTELIEVTSRNRRTRIISSSNIFNITDKMIDLYPYYRFC